MTWLDIVFIAIFAVSALVGVLRGLIKESISLGTWVLAFWVSIRFSSALAGLLPDSLSELEFGLGELQFRVDNLRVGLAMLILFILTLIVGGVVGFLLGHLVKLANFSTADRVLGGVFGLLRAGVLIVGLVLGAGLTTVPRSQSWQESLLVAPFEAAAVWVLGILPDHIAAHFTYAR